MDRAADSVVGLLSDCTEARLLEVGSDAIYDEKYGGDETFDSYPWSINTSARTMIRDHQLRESRSLSVQLI